MECLDSIERQSLGDYELLVVDDGSSDDCPSIVRRRGENDRRIRLISPGRIGLVAALNLGIEQARTPLLARMDADDIMLPDRLRLQCGFLDFHPEVALVGSQVELFPQALIQEGYREYVRWQNACITTEQIAAGIYIESPLAHPSVMVRRSVLQSLDGYADGPFPEDYDLWLRLHRAGHPMAKIPEVLLRWRESRDRTSRIDPRYSREAFDRLRARYLSLDARLDREAGFVIWGAGRKTRLRARHLLEQGRKPVAWIDIDPNKIGTRVQGLPVHAREWLLRSGTRPFVLIYLARHGAREQVVSWLDSNGFSLSTDYLAVG